MPSLLLTGTAPSVLIDMSDDGDAGKNQSGPYTNSEVPCALDQSHPVVGQQGLDRRLLEPHVAAEWFVAVLCIREVQSSNLDPDTGYSD
jgi:hypothetical protein